MFQNKKSFVLMLLALFAISSISAGDVYAYKKGRSSFGSSRPSRSSSFGRSSGSRFGSSRPSSSKPKKPTSSRPGSTNNKKPKFGSGSKPSGSSKSPSSVSGSKKPTSTKPSSAKSQAKKSSISKKKYVQTKTATKPPKKSYVSSSGKTVNVRSKSKAVQSIRSKPSSYYTPERRTERVTNHIHHYHYSHPHSWYYSQPSFYVGGGYSSAFWYMMMEWNAERRARWLYNNQSNIEQSAYERGMKDAAVAAEIAKLKAQNVKPSGDYIDSEFEDNPDLMYSQDYVEAAYNPTVANSGSVLSTIVNVLLLIMILVFIAWFLFFKKWS